MNAEPKASSNSALDPEIPFLPPGTRLTTLENGLTLIIREDHSAPVLSVQAWCKAGSIDEGKWLGAGLSHMLEHMLFKGTTTRGPGRIDQEVQEVGGYMNAYTSFDRTVYYIDLPSEHTAVNPLVLGGSPALTGHRFSADSLARIYWNGGTEAIVRTYPELEEEGVAVEDAVRVGRSLQAV